MEMLSKNQKILVIGGIVIACIIIAMYYISSTKNVYNDNELVFSDEEIAEENKGTEGSTIIVHVTGAVKKQGIVKVKENARINDVIEAAEGLVENADLNNVNLAYIVEDGQKIYIPFETDGTEEQETEAKKGIEEETSINSGKININSASQEKLTELPGIRKFHSIKNYYI